MYIDMYQKTHAPRTFKRKTEAEDPGDMNGKFHGKLQSVSKEISGFQSHGGPPVPDQGSTSLESMMNFSIKPRWDMLVSKVHLLDLNYTPVN